LDRQGIICSSGSRALLHVLKHITCANALRAVRLIHGTGKQASQGKAFARICVTLVWRYETTLGPFLSGTSFDCQLCKTPQERELVTMQSCSIKRQVAGSKLVDSTAKLETLEQLLSVPRGSLKLTALFGTQDKGWDAAAFHTSCDNKGPTLTLVQCTDPATGSHRSEKLFGGFTEVDWTSSGQFRADAKAFLFRFVCPVRAKKSGVPEKFACNGSSAREVYHDQGCGPVFGHKHDFFTFNSGGIASILVEVGTGSNSYDLTGPLVNTTNVPKTPERWRLEVLHVGSIDPNVGELDAPWQRSVLWSPEVSLVSSCTFAKYKRYFYLDHDHAIADVLPWLRICNKGIAWLQHKAATLFYEHRVAESSWVCRTARCCRTRCFPLTPGQNGCQWTASTSCSAAV